MDLIEFFFASGIMGCLMRMTRDVYKIRKVFKTMEGVIGKLQRQVEQHDERISNLEQKGQGNHAQETL